ncbi:MAG: hypothetical protein AAB657_05195 [Patescibacteria group bacterium]
MKSEEAQKREDKFMELFGRTYLNIAYPQNTSLEDVKSNLFEAIPSLQKRFQKIFDISKEQEEQDFIAWQVGRLNNKINELKQYEYTIFPTFFYVAGVSQAIQVYEAAFADLIK